MSTIDYGSQFEWLATNRFLFYPFTARPLSVLNNTDFSSAVVDALFVVPDGWAEPRVQRLEPHGAIWRVTMQDGLTGPTLTEDMDVTICGPWSVVVSEHARFLIHTEEAALLDWGDDWVDGFLVPHVLHREVSGLKSITVNGQKLQGKIILQAGYNTVMSQVTGRSTNSSRGRAPLQLAFRPGAGEGRVPCDEGCPDVPIATINNISPNASGDLVMDGVDCYRVDARLEEGAQGILLVPGELEIGNDCSPCCDCSDYGYVYGEILSDLNDRAKDLARRYKEIRDQYEADLAEYNRIVLCRKNPTFTMQVTGMYDRTASISVGFRNNSDNPWPAVARNVSVVVTPTAKLVQGSPVLFDGNDSDIVAHSFSSSTFTFTLEPIPCCTMHWVTFNVVWDGVGGIVNFAAEVDTIIEGVVCKAAPTGITKLPVNRQRQ